MHHIWGIAWSFELFSTWYVGAKPLQLPLYVLLAESSIKSPGFLEFVQADVVLYVEATQIIEQSVSLQCRQEMSTK